MAKLSNARKFGIFAGVLGKRVGRSRTYNALVSAGRTTGGHFGQVVSHLWLQVTGFVFLFFASVGAIYFVREYMNYRQVHGASTRMVAAMGFALMFGWFGISSFLRVHRRKS